MDGLHFETLGHRIIYSYLVTMPDFVPLPYLEVDVESQAMMHQFLENTIKNIYEQPMLVSIKPSPDEYFHNHEFLNENPKLMQRMNAIEYKIIHFYNMLLKIAKVAQVDSCQMIVPKKECHLLTKSWKNLENFGMMMEENSDSFKVTSPNYTGIFPAWKYLASMEQTGERNKMIGFLFSMYPGKAYTARQLFGKVSQEPELLDQMENYFRENGYVRQTDNLSLTWTLEYPKKERGQYSLRYNYPYLHPYQIDFKIPYFRRILDHLKELDADLQDFIFLRLRNCNSCFYCVQYNRTGTKKLIHQTF